MPATALWPHAVVRGKPWRKRKHKSGDDDEERENAVIGRDRVADRMTPDQLAKVHRLAREWDAAPPLEQ